MDGRTWPKVWTLLVLLLLAERTVGQQPPPTWFNADPAAQAQGPSGLPAEGWPQQLPPIVAQRPVMRPPAMGPPALGPLAMGPENVQMAMQAGQPAAPVSLDMEIDQQAPTLEQQLAGLGKRLDVLEKPPVKYPANVQVLGVFQADAVAFSQELANRATPPNGGVGYIENGADFRRARLGAKAMLADNMNAFFQMDFAFPGRPTFTDLWVDWTDLPVLGNVRVGQWKQPFSLEVVSSFRYTTFMERSLVFQAFTPFRHLGVGAYNHSTDLMSTWAASLLRTGQDQFGDSLSTAGGNGFSGRVTRLLWWDEDAGRSYLHVGGDYFLNSPPKHVTSFRSIPEIFVGQNRSDAANTGTAGFASPFLFDGTPFFANTGNLLNVEHVHTFDLEALWVYGPLSVQAEYMPVLVDRPNVRTAFLDGGYV